jgi:hypothetical protein
MRWPWSEVAEVGTRPGNGTHEREVLAALDGQVREIRELAAEIVGRVPTGSEYVALQRAVHNLARHGLVQLTRVPRGQGGGSGPARAYVLKVGAWIRDGDSFAAADTATVPRDLLAGLVEQAWQAFASDVGYAEEMAAAALRLMSTAELTRLGALRVRDDDGGTGAEVRPQIGVRDVGPRACL